MVNADSLGKNFSYAIPNLRTEMINGNPDFNGGCYPAPNQIRKSRSMQYVNVGVIS
jgi:hypothetical protein